MCLHGAILPLIWYAKGLLSEKNVLTYWPHPWSRGCLWAKYLLPYSCMCHSIYLICNMTIFWKSWILAFARPLKSTQGAGPGLELKSPLICFISVVLLSACKILVKILTTDLIIAKFKYLTFIPTGTSHKLFLKKWSRVSLKIDKDCNACLGLSCFTRQNSPKTLLIIVKL